MKFNLKINARDLANIYGKTSQIEKKLLDPSGFVYKYVFTIGVGYRLAVVSGMGSTVSGMVSLRDFLGTSVTTSWRVNAEETLAIKKKNGWSLSIWKATGEAEDAVEVTIDGNSTGISMFSGIDGSTHPEAFAHAYLTEFGGVATDSPYGNVPERALFTLLWDTFLSKYPVIQQGILDAIKQEIARVGWGR